MVFGILFQKAFDRFEGFQSHGSFDYPNIALFYAVFEKLFRLIGPVYDFYGVYWLSLFVSGMCPSCLDEGELVP